MHLPLLAIDTAAPRLQLALLKADGEADALVADMAKGHAEALFPRIGELLSRNGLAYSDLRRVAATSGPGSFTGVRIGLAAARGLALALSIDALGIPSLLARSLSAPAGGPFAVLFDARRSEAYFQRFSAPGAAEGPGELLLLAEAQRRISGGLPALSDRFVDIGAVARFAAGADASAFPPVPAYLRPADAKPQERARVALA